MLDVHIRIAAHVHDDLFDRAAGECKGSHICILARDRLTAVAPEIETFTYQRELAWLRPNLRRADCSRVDVQRQRAMREQHACGFPRVNIHLGRNGIRAIADVIRPNFGHFGARRSKPGVGLARTG